MLAVAADGGFRAIAPDFRGYGLSDQPAEPDKTTFSDLVSDLLALVDSLGVNKVFIVSKDFGNRPAHYFALFYPDRVAGVITLGGPYAPGPPAYKEGLPEGFYISRWQEPGRAEADFGRFDATTVLRKIYILFSKSEIPIAAEKQEVMDLVDPSAPLPPWFTEEDLAAYGSLYEKSGFGTPLQVPYRALLRELPNVTDPKINVPLLLILGEQDFAFRFPGKEDYVRSGKVKEYVPDMEIEFIPEGSHFVHEQFPDQVNQRILAFLKNHV